MADIFDQIAPSQTKGDIFDQIGSRTPADATPQMKDAQWGAQNPYLRAMQDTANQGPGMLAKGLYNSVPGLSSNVPKPIADMMANYHPENVKTNPVANVGAQVEQGIGSMAGSLPFATPLSKAAGMLPLVGNAGKLGLGGITSSGLGWGATNAAQAMGNGQPILPAAAQGFGQGMAYGMGGAVGKGVGQMVGQPLAGQALGMSGTGAMMAPSGSKISGAILGGGFGMDKGLPDPQDMIDNEGQKIYRSILNLGKGITNKLEIKSGKDVDDSMNLAAEHGLILDSNEGKLDNLGAIEQTKQLAKPYYNQINQILGQNQSTIPGKGGFDLKVLGKNVNDSFDDPNSPAYIKNAQDAAAAKSKVNDLIQAEIDRPGVGQYVNAQKLNTIKQGMWEKSYNPLEPNANDAARQVGFGAKNLIEQAYPTDDIKGLNAQTGRYLTLQKVLEQTHGQTVKGGKLGNHLAAGASGIIGALAGSHIPIPVIGEMVGGAVGGFAGENISKFANDPNRITTGWANRLNAAKQASMPIQQNPVTNPMGQSRNPNVMNAELVPRQIGASMSPVAGHLGYDRVGAYGASRMAGEGEPMVTPAPMKQEMPINQVPNPGALAIGQQWKGSPNEPQILPNVHDVIQMRGASMSATNPLNFNPKTSSSNGPLQPNPRAMIDMSKGGMDQNAGAPIPQQPIQQRIPQGNTMGGSMNPLSNMSPEQLKIVEKNIKLTKNQVEREKIIRS